MKNILIMFLIAFIYSGCASKYPVTFDSNPQGATIICNGTNFGYSPETIYYDEEVKKNSSLNLGSCSANWMSGATKQYGIIDLNQFPNGVIQTLQRPNVDGYEKDTQFALQVEIMYAQKRQAAAAESAANAAAINSFNQSMQNVTNQLNQNTYDTQQSAYQLQQMNNQTSQRQQDKKTNYQLQQINNNLNNIRYGY